jgi:flagellar hook-associated protein 2
VGSPITFSGFNNIDFNMILETVMQQARQPLTTLQSRQSGMKSQLTALGKLTSQANTLRTAAKDLAATASGDTVSASTTDAGAVSVATRSGAVAGRYDVVVQSLARAQVTASTTTAPDPDTTEIATGGSLTIGDVTVTLTGSTTLRGLATAINGTDDIGVTASVVQSGAGAYRLVLTGKDTGVEEAFSITNDLTGSTLAFGANAVEATDASVLINNVAVTSSTNTLDEAIPGLTLTVLKQDPAETIGINVASDPAAVKTRLEAFIKAYNDVNQFYIDQQTAATKGDPSLSRDPMARQLRSTLRAAMMADYGSGAYDRLSQIGVEFTLTGTLKLDTTRFDEALADDPDAVLALLGGESGAFTTLQTMLEEYTNPDGLLINGRNRLQDQVRAMDRQLFQAEERLAKQRQTLQQEFIAAEMAMSRLRSQSGALSGTGG